MREVKQTALAIPFVLPSYDDPSESDERHPHPNTDVVDDQQM